MATWPGWVQDVLRTGGWPVSGQNISFLSAWQAYEGGGATNNPLNTTQGPGTRYNSVGVKNFASPQVGAQATVATLRNGHYPAVIAALRTGTPYDVPYISQVADQIRVWGTHNFAAQLDSHSDRGGRTDLPSQAYGSAIPQSGTDASGWAWAGAEGSKIADAIRGPLDFLKAALWLLDPRNWLRAVEMVVGMVLMTLGVVFLARTLMEPGSILAQIKPPTGDAEHPTSRAFRMGEEEGERAAARSAGRQSGRKRYVASQPSAQGRRQATSPNDDDIPF